MSKPIKVGDGRTRTNTKRKYYSLKDSEQVFRILPGLGDLADSNRWSIFYSVHYGYKTTDNKGIPFVSPEVKDYKKKVTTVTDAAKERLELLNSELEKAKKSGNGVVVSKLNSLLGYYDSTSKKFVNGIYNLDSNHYMNVVDLQGNIGILKLRHKAKLVLEKEIRDLEEKGIYPLSPEDGRFFIMSKGGSGRDTTFSVKEYKEKVALDETTAKSLGLAPGSTIDRPFPHKLDDGLIARLGSEAAELDKLFKRPTAEDVKLIVEKSDIMTGVSSHMDELFGKGNTAEDTSEGHEENGAEETTTAPTSNFTGGTSQEAARLVTANVTATSVPQQTAIIAPTSLPQGAVQVSSGKSQAQTITEMSQDEFMRRLESGTL